MFTYEEDVIAELSEPTQSDAGTDVSKPQNPQINGGEMINAESQSSSDSKEKVKDFLLHQSAPIAAASAKFSPHLGAKIVWKNEKCKFYEYFFVSRNKS